MKLINHWIDNEEHQGAPLRTGNVFDPATGDITAEVAFAGADEVDLAVASAGRALSTWRATPVTRRQKILFEYRDIVAERAGEIGAILTSQYMQALLSTAEMIAQFGVAPGAFPLAETRIQNRKLLKFTLLE